MQIRTISANLPILVYCKWMCAWNVQFDVFSIAITWFDRGVSWFGALCSNCDDSGLCLVDVEAVESTKWTVAVLIFSVGFAGGVIECAAQQSFTVLLKLAFECGDFFCLHSNCVCSFRSCSPMDDINDDDGDDGNDSADDDDWVFVYWSVDWLMQTLDVDGANIGPPSFSSWLSWFIWWHDICWLWWLLWQWRIDNGCMNRIIWKRNDGNTSEWANTKQTDWICFSLDNVYYLKERIEMMFNEMRVCDFDKKKSVTKTMQSNTTVQIYGCKDRNKNCRFELTSSGSIMSPVFTSMISPNTRPLILHLLNVMMFWVSVPVLSLKIYWIWPSSSLSVVVRARAGVSFFS